jgi:hypothetical protein
VGSSRRCSGSRRRLGCAETGAGSRQESWQLGQRRCDVERQEQASASRGSGDADAGVTRGARKGGAEAAGARHMASEGGGGASGRGKSEQSRVLEEEDED